MEPHILTHLPDHWADPVFTAAQAAAQLAQPHHILLGLGPAGQGGYLLGSLMPHAQADVLTLYVPPAHRRQGHARRLLQAFLSHARTAGCTGLTLEVESTNHAAIHLYTVCGLQQVGKRPGYYPSKSTDSVSNRKADALVMAVFLA